MLTKKKTKAKTTEIPKKIRAEPSVNMTVRIDANRFEMKSMILRMRFSFSIPKNFAVWQLTNIIITHFT